MKIRLEDLEKEIGCVEARVVALLSDVLSFEMMDDNRGDFQFWVKVCQLLPKELLEDDFRKNYILWAIDKAEDAIKTPEQTDFLYQVISGRNLPMNWLHELHNDILLRLYFQENDPKKQSKIAMEIIMKTKTPLELIKYIAKMKGPLKEKAMAEITNMAKVGIEFAITT